MSECSLTAAGDGLYRIDGQLDFDSVPKLLADGARMFSESSLVLDLGGVTHANSAALGLLLEWVDEAKSAGRGLVFRNIPQSVLSIADVCNVEALLTSLERKPN